MPDRGFFSIFKDFSNEKGKGNFAQFLGNLLLETVVIWRNHYCMSAKLSSLKKKKWVGFDAQCGIPSSVDFLISISPRTSESALLYYSHHIKGFCDKGFIFFCKKIIFIKSPIIVRKHFWVESKFYKKSCVGETLGMKLLWQNLSQPSTLW